jgi:putative ABC transport system ATP-binding protein
VDSVSGPVIDAHDLYRFFHAAEDETLALRGVSLQVGAGEMVAIVGPSGSGKSTLLNCLTGIDEPDGGWVTICGERLSHRPEGARAQLRARKLGILSQSGNLLSDLTVGENLSVVGSLQRSPRTSDERALLEALDLAEKYDAMPAQLSGGEAARAGLAVALVNQPAALFADEPTGELDTANEARVLGLLRERAANGMAVVIVTHNDQIAAAASRIVRLVDGQLRHD